MLEGWIVAPPPLIGAAWLAARRRPRVGDGPRRWVEPAAFAYAALQACLTLFLLPVEAAVIAAGRAAGPLLDVNLVPFATVAGALRAGPGTHAWWILLGNVAAFAPPGFLAPLLVRSRAPVRTALVAGIAGSTAVETAKLGGLARAGLGYRTVDIDDVIVNTAGAFLGGVAIVAMAAASGRARAGWRGLV